MSSRQPNPPRFAAVFQSTIMPALEELMKRIGPEDHAIMVLDGGAPGRRILEVMTPSEMDQAAQENIRDLVDRSIPDAMRQTTRLDVQFTTGRVERSASSGRR